LPADLILEVEGLCAGYGAVAVLRGVGLQVRRGESVAIVGANGAGKSTLVRALCGLARVSAGRITLDGTDMTHLPANRRVRAGLATVLEGRHLFGELTLLSQLMLARKLGSLRGHQRFRIDDVVAMFPSMRHRMGTPVELLSGGEQQMIAIARALLLQPDILIMDEPSTGLAPRVIADMVAAIDQLRILGMSILLVEQNARLAATLTERAYVMSLGRIVHEVSAREWRDLVDDDVLTRSYLAG